MIEHLAIVTTTRAGSSPTTATNVQFSVAFSPPVTGLSAGNFALTTSGVTGASITGVAGSGTAWSITIHTGSGAGRLRLDLANSTGLQEGNGAAIGNLPYTGGESYTIAERPDSNLVASLSYVRGPTNSITLMLTVESLGPSAADGALVSATLPALPNNGV